MGLVYFLGFADNPQILAVKSAGEPFDRSFPFLDARGKPLLGALLLYSLRSWLAAILKVELLLPSVPGLAAATIGSFVIALLLVLPGILYPAIRASRLDPAVAMRER